MNLLLFDVDGTLLDTSVDDDRLFREALLEGLPPGAQRVEIPPWETFAEVSDPAIARAVITRACGRRALDSEVMIVRRNFIRKWQQALDSGAVVVRARPGALELVTAVRQRPQFTAAIVSGGWGPTTIMKLAAAGFHTDNFVIATADDGESRLGIFRTAMMVAAAERGTPGFVATVVVGDGIWDARAAQATRSGFIGVGTGAEAITRLRAAGAAAVVPHFEPHDTFWRAVNAALKQQHAATSN